MGLEHLGHGKEECLAAVLALLSCLDFFSCLVEVLVEDLPQVCLFLEDHFDGGALGAQVALGAVEEVRGELGGVSGLEGVPGVAVGDRETRLEVAHNGVTGLRGLNVAVDVLTLGLTLLVDAPEVVDLGLRSELEGVDLSGSNDGVLVAHVLLEGDPEDVLVGGHVVLLVLDIDDFESTYRLKVNGVNSSVLCVR